MIQQMYDTIIGRRSVAGRLAGALIGASFALGITGCDSEVNEANAKIAQANHLIAAINAGGGSSANAPHREDAYDRVVAMLRPVISGSSGATRGAAQVITAQALAGKGRFESVRAMRTENECLDLISAAHNEADLFAAHSSLARALVKYDPQAEFDDLRKQADQVNKEIEEVRATLRGIDEQIVKFKTRSEAAREEAASRHRHETELRAEAVSAGAEQRRDLIKEAVAYQREADAFEAEFVIVDAGIEQFEQTRVSVQADLDRLVTQRGLLEEAQRHAQRRMQVAMDESKSAEEAALEAAKRLRSIVLEIRTLRKDTLSDLYLQAEETLDKAATSLIAGARSDTSREGKNSSSINIGMIHQAIGELRRLRAAGAEDFAALLRRLDAMDPALPDRSYYREALAMIEAVRDEALAGAEDAFSQAADALERAGGSDAMQSRIERVVSAIRREADEQGDHDMDNMNSMDGMDRSGG